MVFPVARLVTEMDSLIELRINTFLFLFALVVSLIGCHLCFVISNTKGGHCTASYKP